MKLFVFAGEVSADLCGGRIVHECKAIQPDVEVFGVGGSSLKAAGQTQLLESSEFQVMGFSDVLKHLPKLLRNFYTVRNAILALSPDIVLFIDGPALSMRMAKALRKKGYRGKIVQLVAPSVWAYKPERAEQMANTFDLLLTLFDFEPKYFAHTALKTVFVGHPLLEWIEKAGSFHSRPHLALFPGSRPDEIRRNLPKQLEAAFLFREKHPEFEVVVSGRDVPFEKRYELMQRATCAIAKCGTVTLELALFNVPTVVTYELTFLNRFMAKHFLRLDHMKHFAIANILAGKELFPECIREHTTPSEIAEKLLEIYTQKIDCKSLYTHIFAGKTASKRIAEELFSLVS